MKVADGPERVTVAEVDGLLYLSGHSREQLERALRIPALSKGWQASFEAILKQESGEEASGGNAGLANEEEPPPRGRVQTDAAGDSRGEQGVSSFTLVPVDGQPMSLPRAGQFVVLRLQVDPGKPPVLRSYSLSDLPAADHLRISVKAEVNGIGSAYLSTAHAHEGDVLDVSAPRGSFVVRPADGPVVLLSAGVGATPVLSMLHALAAENSRRSVWWIYGSRDRASHPFLEEARALLKQLPGARSYIVYSKPEPVTSRRWTSMLMGTLTQLFWKRSACLAKLTSTCAAPRRFWRACARDGQSGACPPRTFTWKFLAHSKGSRRAWRRFSTRHMFLRDRRDPGLRYRSRAAASTSTGIPSLRACWNWPKPATFRFAGRVEPECATRA